MQIINRCRINSRAVVLFLPIILLLAGCTNENTGIDEGTGDAIAFDCSTTPNMRAAETTTDNMQYFRVSAIWDKAGTGYATFMNNQLVEKQEDEWVYSPIKHWPGYGSVSFFAYSPATSSGMESFQINKDDNTVTIGYKVSKEYQQQEDFIVATNLDSDSNPIRLDFKHVLSNITFRVRGKDEDSGATLRVKEITLSNVYGEGTLIGAANENKLTTWQWELSGLTEYSVYQKHPIETPSLDSEYVEIGDLMVLPQKPGTSFEITVRYDVVGGTAGDSFTNYIAFNDDLEFEMGNKYTLYLDLNK